MSISRNFALVIHFILDQLIPPIIRDSHWFMWILMRITIGKDLHWLHGFKEKVMSLSDQDIEEYYRNSADVHLERDTDLNSACIEKILNSIDGNRVLDIACGRGFLTKLLAKEYSVTGADFVIDDRMKAQNSDIEWDEVNVNSLLYRKDQFDTVVCAHTLEHVVDVNGAIAELRRVAKNTLIVVLPKQRPYQYTFDLHLHFFFYKWQVEMLMKTNDNDTTGYCENVAGDWLYIEKYNNNKVI